MTCCKENLDTSIRQDKASLLSDISGKRKKKFTGGNASKRHRDRVNIEFSNLAKLLPFSDSVIAKLDKSSILRLAVSFIRAKSFFRDTERTFEAKKLTEKDVLSIIPRRLIMEGTGALSEIFPQALDGFLLVLTEDMKVLFVSESVREYLGYCQAGIIHENFLQFVNPSDHSVIKSSLMSKTEQEKPYNGYHMFNQNQSICHEENNTNRNKSSRQFVCRMKCAFSCSSRFYTAYRRFGFNGCLRRSTIQDGRELKHLNSLLLFVSPFPTASAPSGKTIHDYFEGMTTSHKITDSSLKINDLTSYYNRFASGFRIEPTLRPHIVPIPVPRNQVELSTTRQHIRSSIFDDIQFLNMPQSEYTYTFSDTQLSVTKSFSLPSSIESRYSDYSDDSKYSPASSPNLNWKNISRNGFNPQNFGISFVTERTLDINREKNIHKNDYSESKQTQSPKPHLCERSYSIMKGKRNTYSNIHPELNVFTNHENLRNCVNYHCTSEENKRNLYPVYLKPINNECTTSQQNNMNPTILTKNSDFNISSLLGLDKKESRMNNDHKSLNRDEEVDVCNLEDGEKNGCCNELLESIPIKLDISWTRVLPSTTASNQ